MKDKLDGKIEHAGGFYLESKTDYVEAMRISKRIIPTNHQKEFTYTLPETNSSPLKINGWKMSFQFGEANFHRRTVRFREYSWSLVNCGITT